MQPPSAAYSPPSWCSASRSGALVSINCLVTALSTPLQLPHGRQHTPPAGTWALPPRLLAHLPQPPSASRSRSLVDCVSSTFCRSWFSARIMHQIVKDSRCASAARCRVRHTRHVRLGVLEVDDPHRRALLRRLAGRSTIWLSMNSSASRPRVAASASARGPGRRAGIAPPLRDASMQERVELEPDLHLERLDGRRRLVVDFAHHRERRFVLPCFGDTATLVARRLGAGYLSALRAQLTTCPAQTTRTGALADPAEGPAHATFPASGPIEVGKLVVLPAKGSGGRRRKRGGAHIAAVPAAGAEPRCPGASQHSWRASAGAPACRAARARARGSARRGRGAHPSSARRTRPRRGSPSASPTAQPAVGPAIPAARTPRWRGCRRRRAASPSQSTRCFGVESSVSNRWMSAACWKMLKAVCWCGISTTRNRAMGRSCRMADCGPSSAAAAASPSSL